jgi:succinate dehydrogenase/fumarate reductase cytochrome b subunit
LRVLSAALSVLSNLASMPAVLSLFICAIAASPVLAEAATLRSIVATMVDYLGKVIPTIILMAFLLYLFNIVWYGLIEKGGVNANKMLKETVPWGLLILVVMVSVWGIVRLISETFFGT